MKNTGILRIQAFAARQSSPVEGVTVTVSGDGFTATRLTDAEGNADDVTLTTPPDVKIGTTIFSKKAKNKPHKVSHWVKTIGKPYAAYSYLF